MFFAPYVIRGSNAEKVLVQILPASPEDLAATKGTPSWQTDWESEYLSQPSVDKFALKLENGELLPLGAYQISGRKAYVYILYVESAPQSNPTLTTSARREYYGIGEVMIEQHAVHAGDVQLLQYLADTVKVAVHQRHMIQIITQPLPGGGDGRFVPVDADETAGGQAAGDLQRVARPAQRTVHVHAVGPDAERVQTFLQQHRAVSIGEILLYIVV